MIGLSIDPGKNTGICLFRYDDKGFSVIKLWQFLGGAEQLDVWLDQYLSFWDADLPEEGETPIVVKASNEYLAITSLVVEKFTPRQNENFSLTLDSVEPLVCEGVLVAHKLKPFIQWAQPSQQYFMGDSALPLIRKKKLAREFLETNGLLPKGSEFGYKDGNDAVSATLHAIAFLRRKRHYPTLYQLFG